MIQFKYGSLEKFKSLEQKDPDVLYFLDNHSLYKGNELISIVRTVSGNFPETPTEDMKETYQISLQTGEIRYVTNDLKYIKITELAFGNIVINKTFTDKLVETIGTKKITMPILAVEENTLVWTPANENSFTILNI